MRLDWQDEASCKDYPNDWWFRPMVAGNPHGGPQPTDPYTDAARRVCEGCPVKGECLDMALENRESWGIWGGMDRHERKLEVRRRQRRAKAAA